eukprot:jgi/Botrbrau1/10964/Bobra.0383s0018.1
MLEGWLSDLLAGYLGHFLDVKKEQLRVSLWNAWSTGFVLENVQIKVDAFDYLLLPVDVRQGCIGRLEVQVPWRNLRTRPVVVELSDVYLEVCERPESQWEEDAATQRKLAAKRATLASKELEQLSRPSNARVQDAQDGKGSTWWFLSMLGQRIINRLQLSVRNVHLKFQGQQQTAFGVHLVCLETISALQDPSLVSTAEPSGQVAFLLKDFVIDGLSFYWVIDEIASSAESENERSPSLADVKDTAGTSVVRTADYILLPLSCTIKLNMSTSSGTDRGSPAMHLDGEICTDQVTMQLNQAQLRDITVFKSKVDVWSKRNKYGHLRPGGWRSAPRCRVSSRLLWRYAIRAIIEDLPDRGSWRRGASLRVFQEKRHKYIGLYKQRMDMLKQIGGSQMSYSDIHDLQQLEDELDISDILLFRYLAERGRSSASMTNPESNSDVPKRQGWMTRSLSSLAKYLGYVPTEGQVQPVQPLSEMDVQDLYRELEGAEELVQEDRAVPPSRQFSLVAKVRTASVVIMGESTGVDHVASVGMHGISANCSLEAGAMSATFHVFDMEVQDLCSDGPGVSSGLLCVWDKGGTSQGNQRGLSARSPMLSATIVESFQLEPTRGGLHISVHVQPLQLRIRPLCFKRLKDLGSSMPNDSYESLVMDSVNQLSTPSARTLAKGELLMNSSSRARVHIKVSDVLVVLHGDESSSKTNPAILLTSGAIDFKQHASVAKPGLSELVEMVKRHLQSHENANMQSCKDILNEIEKRLYSNGDITVSGMQLRVSENINPFSEASTPIIYPLQLSATLGLSRLADRLLPSIRVTAKCSDVDARVGIQQMREIQKLLSLPESPHHTSSEAPCSSLLTKGWPNITPRSYEEAPKIDAKLTLPSCRFTMDHGESSSPDAEDLHLVFAFGLLKMNCKLFHKGLYCLGSLDNIECQDNTNYSVMPPNPVGHFPRLGKAVNVSSVLFLIAKHTLMGMIASIEMRALQVRGYDEGSGIQRASLDSPATVYVSHHSNLLLRQTAIRGQNFAVGADLLLRALAWGQRHVSSRASSQGYGNKVILPINPEGPNVKESCPATLMGLTDEDELYVPSLAEELAGPSTIGCSLSHLNVPNGATREGPHCDSPHVNVPGGAASQGIASSVETARSADTMHQVFLEVCKCRLTVAGIEAQDPEGRVSAAQHGQIVLDVRRLVLEIAPHEGANYLQVHPIEVHRQLLVNERVHVERSSSLATFFPWQSGHPVEIIDFIAEGITVKVLVDGEDSGPWSTTLLNVPKVAVTAFDRQMPPVEVCFDSRVSQLVVPHCDVHINQICVSLASGALEIACNIFDSCRELWESWLPADMDDAPLNPTVDEANASDRGPARSTASQFGKGCSVKLNLECVETSLTCDPRSDNCQTVAMRIRDVVALVATDGCGVFAAQLGLADLVLELQTNMRKAHFQSHVDGQQQDPNASGPPVRVIDRSLSAPVVSQHTSGVLGRLGQHMQSRDNGPAYRTFHLSSRHSHDGQSRMELVTEEGLFSHTTDYGEKSLAPTSVDKLGNACLDSMCGETESNTEFYDLTERDTDSQTSGVQQDGIDGTPFEHEDDARRKLLLIWSRDGFPCTQDNVQIPIAATCCIEISDAEANAWTMTFAASTSRLVVTLQDWDAVLQSLVDFFSGPLAMLKLLAKSKEKDGNALHAGLFGRDPQVALKLTTEELQLCLVPERVDGRRSPRSGLELVFSLLYERTAKDSISSIDSLAVPVLKILAHLPSLTSPRNELLLDAVILKARKIELTRSCGPAGMGPSSTAFLLAVEEITGSPSYRQMCGLTVVGLAARALVSKLQILARNVSPANTLDASPAVPNSDLSLALTIRKADFAISTCSEQQTIPLLLVSFAAVRLDFAFDASNGLLNATAVLEMGIQSYSWVKRGWEPFLERWSVTVQLDCRARSLLEAFSGKGSHQLVLSSTDVLELTIPEHFMFSVDVIHEMATVIIGLLNGTIEMQSALDRSPGGSKLPVFKLQNMTGTAVEVWAKLADGTMTRPKRIGSPASSLIGDTLDDATNMAAFRPSAFCFRLEGQDGFCGPISFASAGSNLESVVVRPSTDCLPSRVLVGCDVVCGPHGNTEVTVHSAVQVQNLTRIPLNVGLQTPLGLEPTKLGVLGPCMTLWLPVLRAEPGLLCLQPSGNDIDGMPRYLWSPGLRVDPLLEQAADLERLRRTGRRVARQLSCQGRDGSVPPCRFHAGIIKHPDASGWLLVLKPPIIVVNSLPVPVIMEVYPSNVRLHLDLQGSGHILQLSAGEIDKVTVLAHGYKCSHPIKVPKFEQKTGSDRVKGEAEVNFDVLEEGEGGGHATFYLKFGPDPETGSSVLRLVCACWVYNCLGIPIALQQVKDAGWRSDLSEDQDHDTVPKTWIRPYESSTQQQLLSQHSAKQSRSNVVDVHHPSEVNLEGLGQVLDKSNISNNRIVSLNMTASLHARPRGMAESMSTLPSFSVPSRWPIILGGFAPRQRLRLRVRASPIRASHGRIFWSDEVIIDPVGGAAVVNLPYPMDGLGVPVQESYAGYVASITASQVDGSEGALSLKVAPRYVLHNLLGSALQFKQHGSPPEASQALLAGTAKPVHWADLTRPLWLCMRTQGPGWMWSGGVALESPGDLFVKIRHRDKGETLLLQVDIKTSSDGVLLICVSHQAVGFSPYRIDNCTSETLHLRQEGCSELEDVLRPYSSLNYAWDEPSLAHRLILLLPGNRTLGTFSLDKVGEASTLVIPGRPSKFQKEKVLRAFVKAEGPTCVLLIVDLEVHVPHFVSTSQQSDQGWEHWSSSLAVSPLSPSIAAAPSAVFTGLEVRILISGVGLSLMLPNQEVAYARMAGLKLRATSNKVKRTWEWSVRSVQADNPSPGACFPVVLEMPYHPPPVALGLVADAVPALVGTNRGSASSGRVAIWQRQPAGVLCIELLEIRIAPYIVELEQSFLTVLADFFAEFAKPFGISRICQDRSPSDGPDIGFLQPGSASGNVQEQKIYIERLHIPRIGVTLSFVPSWTESNDMQHEGSGRRLGNFNVVSFLGEVEGASLSLKALELQHPLLAKSALIQVIYSHYMRTLLPELIKLIGSANALGDPVRLIHHLGLGFWSFIANPAVGLVESARGQGPLRFAEGILHGMLGLLSNSIFAVSNAMAKLLSAARKGLVVLGLDPRLVSRHRLSGLMDHAEEDNLLAAIMDGIAGIVSEPVRGADEGGLVGLLRGTVRGALGALLRPTASLLDMSSRVADSLRLAVMGPRHMASRLRPPRYVPLSKPLPAYDWSEAMGRFLLSAAGEQFVTEEFVACRQLEGGNQYIILTTRLLICTTVPSLRERPSIAWAVLRKDIIHTRMLEEYLTILSLQPGWVTPVAINRGGFRGVVPWSSGFPYISACLQFKNPDDASFISNCISDVEVLKRWKHLDVTWSGLPSFKMIRVYTATDAIGMDVDSANHGLTDALIRQISAFVRNPGA